MIDRLGISCECLFVPAKHNIRRAAAAALHAWAKGHDYAETLVERHAQRYQLSSADRHLLHAILFGVLRQRRLLDHFIGKARQGKLDPDVKDLLRIGLYQVLMLNIADHAAVNETVDAGKSNIRGLVNAVLRRAIGQRARWLESMAELPPEVQLSHPDWLFNRWKKRYGVDEAVALMDWNQSPALTYARYNPLCGQACPINAPVTDADGFHLLEGPIPHQWLAQGVIYIQDPATRHAVELLNAQPGESVLDACAAPGGKAGMIAGMMQNRGELMATDSNPKRLPRLSENLARLHVTCATVAAHDWLEPAPVDWLGKFDAILLDVPCSNTGVMRRRVDVRWRLQLPDILSLVEKQRRIVMNALPCLKPDGRLVYSTCSLEPEENERLVESLVQDATLHLRCVEIRQALPQRDASDGAFAALLRKAL